MIRCAALCFFLALTSPVFAQAQHSLKMLKGEDNGLVPRYLLEGPNGRSITNEDFRGRFQLISFGYTYCPDVCPTTLIEMAAILKLLDEKSAKLQAIFITVDPERDSSTVLKTYTEFFDRRIIGLTGSPALVRRAADNFKIRYAKVPSSDSKNYAVDHSAGMILLGPDGQFIKKFPFAMPVDQIAKEIDDLISRK
jgi:protein SCO1/2